MSKLVFRCDVQCTRGVTSIGFKFNLNFCTIVKGERCTNLTIDLNSTISRLFNSNCTSLNGCSSCREGCTRSTNCSSSLVKLTSRIAFSRCKSCSKFSTIRSREARGMVCSTIINCNCLASRLINSNSVRINRSISRCSNSYILNLLEESKAAPVTESLDAV